MKRKFLLTSPTTITGLPSAAVLLLAFVIPSLQASVTVLSQQSRIFGSWYEDGYADILIRPSAALKQESKPL